MRKIKYIIISLIFITLITGCNSKEKSPLKVAHNNTSISEKKVNSYRVKISIRSNDIEEKLEFYKYNKKVVQSINERFIKKDSWSRIFTIRSL